MTTADKSTFGSGGVSWANLVRTVILTWLAAYSAFVYVPDVYMYYRQVDVAGDKVWYSPNWYRQPYTNARLALVGAKRELWSHNALGQPWLVREVDCDGKVWWTILKRGT